MRSLVKGDNWEHLKTMLFNFDDMKNEIPQTMFQSKSAMWAFQALAGSVIQDVAWMHGTPFFLHPFFVSAHTHTQSHREDFNAGTR